MAKPPNVFGALEEALYLTRVVLFHPFNLSKWCVLGFVAFIMVSGSGESGDIFVFLTNLFYNASSIFFPIFQGNNTSSHNDLASLIPIVILSASVFIVIYFICLFMGSVGKFMFIHALATGETNISATWKQYLLQGTSYFFYRIIGIILCFLVLGLFIYGTYVFYKDDFMRADPTNLSDWSFLILPVFVFFLLSLALFPLNYFLSYLLPISAYASKSSVSAALIASLNLFFKNFVPSLLFFLLAFGLQFIAIIIITLLTCILCCILWIPYLNVVLILPYFVFMTAFPMCYLRTFDERFNPFSENFHNLLLPRP